MQAGKACVFSRDGATTERGHGPAFEDRPWPGRVFKDAKERAEASRPSPRTLAEHWLGGKVYFSAVGRAGASGAPRRGPSLWGSIGRECSRCNRSRVIGNCKINEEPHLAVFTRAVIRRINQPVYSRSILCTRATTCWFSASPTSSSASFAPRSATRPLRAHRAVPGGGCSTADRISRVSGSAART